MQDLNELSSVKQHLSSSELVRLNREFETAHPDRILEWGAGIFGSKIVLGTGFGPSGMLLIHRLHELGLKTTIFYLDTHLLFNETYDLRDRVEERYDIQITRVSTNLSVKEQEQKYGEELWKNDPDRCCYLRKVRPLRNYLSDKKAWITGVRRNQSETRKQTRIIEWDPENAVVKINPLAAWTDDEVWEYINDHNLPYNPLHDDGYPSIGCIPCTQPVEHAENQRNGRWNGSQKTECGIHVSSQKYQQKRTG